MKRYTSKSNSKLTFFVEPVTDNGSSVSYVVVSQMAGYAATEAHDDWFANKQDAEEIAQQLANEE
jgi:hypothetical protein